MSPSSRLTAAESAPMEITENDRFIPTELRNLEWERKTPPAIADKLDKWLGQSEMHWQAVKTLSTRIMVHACQLEFLQDHDFVLAIGKPEAKAAQERETYKDMGIELFFILRLFLEKMAGLTWDETRPGVLYILKRTAEPLGWQDSAERISRMPGLMFEYPRL